MITAEGRRVRVVVIGAGIGGLAVAVALHRCGVEVGVHERGRAGTGNGLGIAANGLRVLAGLGLAEDVTRAGAPIAGMRLRAADGRHLADYDLGADGLIGVRRRDLVDVLAAALPPGLVRHGTGAVSVDSDENSATVRLSDGSGVDADVVIGADGVRSTVAGHVLAPPPLRDSGRFVLRGLARGHDLPPDVRRAQTAWLGHDRHLLCYPVDAAGTMVVAGFVPHPPGRSVPAGPGDIRDDDLAGTLRAAFDGWDPVAADVLDRVDDVTRHELVDRAPFRPWRTGRVCLLGDAAHPMLPHTGQGANQALEDAAVLAGALTDPVPSGPRELAARLDAYEQTRAPRTDRVQERSRRNGDLFSGGLLALGADRPAPPDLSWLYDYDAPAVGRGL